MSAAQHTARKQHGKGRCQFRNGFSKLLVTFVDPAAVFALAFLKGFEQFPAPIMFGSFNVGERVFSKGFDHPFYTAVSTSVAAARFLGLDRSQIGNAIAVDMSGTMYLTGFTTSVNFPVVNPLQSTAAGAFIAKLTGAAVNERLPASLACATLGIEAGVQIIRAHDVAETIQAVRLVEAVLAKK